MAGRFRVSSLRCRVSRHCRSLSLHLIHDASDSLNNVPTRSDGNGDGSTGPAAETYSYENLSRPKR